MQTYVEFGSCKRMGGRPGLSIGINIVSLLLLSVGPLMALAAPHTYLRSPTLLNAIGWLGALLMRSAVLLVEPVGLNEPYILRSYTLALLGGVVCDDRFLTYLKLCLAGTAVYMPLHAFLMIGRAGRPMGHVLRMLCRYPLLLSGAMVLHMLLDARSRAHGRRVRRGMRTGSMHAAALWLNTTGHSYGDPVVTRRGRRISYTSSISDSANASQVSP